jgi:hypothetical protein
MLNRNALGRRGLLAALLIGFTVIAAIYAVFAAITGGIGSAVVPILVAFIFSFNCWLVLTERVFPPPD